MKKITVKISSGKLFGQRFFDSKIFFIYFLKLLIISPYKKYNRVSVSLNTILFLAKVRKKILNFIKPPFFQFFFIKVVTVVFCKVVEHKFFCKLAKF